MVPLYEHQRNFLELNPDKALLAWEAGTGKTRTAIEWMKKREEYFPVIVVPKAIKDKWKDDLIKWKYKEKSLVLTKEEFKKGSYKILSKKKRMIVVDEAHNFSSPLFTRQRSQLSESLYNFIKADETMPRLLLTANPVRSSPANLHTLLTFIGLRVSWQRWQESFYTLVRRPFLPRPAWEPRKGWQKRMIPIIEEYCHVALMRDCFDVPIHEYQTIDIKLEEETKKKVKAVENREWEPMKVWCEQHRLENGKEKLKWIEEFSKGRRKIVVVCRYKEQIKMYAEVLKKDREVFVLTGETKDQGKVIKDAQESPECYLILQSQIGVGFDLDQFSTMIFASCDWSYVNYSQMHGRINRAHNLHRNEYIYLTAGEKDEAIISRLKEGADFDVAQVIKKV